jgi:hypothetical protein
MVSIRPGVTADVIFEGDETKQQIPRMQSMVYSVEGKCVLLSQTTPLISNAWLGKRLLVTFLEANEGTSLRYGFWGRLKGLKNYELTPSQLVPALVLEQETEPRKYNLRMDFRIKPVINKGLGAFFQGTPVTIVDISVGGIRISTKTDLSLKVHDTIKLTIGVDDAKFDVEGKVIRAWSAKAGGGSGLNFYASVQFLDNQTARESLLSRKIILLERELLAHGIQ